MDSNLLPNHILKLMSDKDRKSLGDAGRTTEEINKSNDKKLEKEIHDEIIQWLNLHRIPYSHSRTDKRTTSNLGEPDFRVYHRNQVVFIEVKRGGNTPSKDQISYFEKLHQAGCTVLLCDNSKDAIDYMKACFHI